MTPPFIWQKQLSLLYSFLSEKEEDLPNHISIRWPANGKALDTSENGILISLKTRQSRASPSGEARLCRALFSYATLAFRDFSQRIESVTLRSFCNNSIL